VVAAAINELGNVASMRDHLDEAEARFRRAADIYRAVYGGPNWPTRRARPSMPARSETPDARR